MSTKLGKVLLVLSSLAIVALAAVTYDAQAKGGNKNPGVIPPNAKFRGLTSGEWGARFWQAAYAIPVVDGDHPFFSGGAFGGDDGVVFLAGVGGGATIEVTVPAGTALFFPILNTECSFIEPDPFHGEDEAEMRQCANDHIDQTSALFATIDGRAVNNLSDYRTESPLFVFGPLPEDNLLQSFGIDAPAGTTSPAVDAGFYLMVAPLSVGEHEIHFGGTFDEFGFSIDTTYIVTVVPN